MRNLKWFGVSWSIVAITTCGWLASPWPACAGGPLDTWHVRNVPLAPSSFYGIVYGNGRFVAWDWSRLYSSTNGLNWSTHLSPSEDMAVWFENGLFLGSFSVDAFPDDEWVEVQTSLDGSVWKYSATMPYRDDPGEIENLVYGNGRFVATGGWSDSLFVSTNATDWTEALYRTCQFDDIAFGAGVFLAVEGLYDSVWRTSFCAISTSTDGLVWTYQWLEPNEDYGYLVAFGNGRFVVDAWSYSFISSDGVNWSTVNAPPGDGLTFQGGYFVSFGETNLWISTDGLSWESHDLGTNCRPQAIAYGNDSFVVTGSSVTTNRAGNYYGVILQSDPLTNATPVTPVTLTIGQLPSLTITGEAGRQYQIEYTSDVSDPNSWQQLATIPLTTSPYLWVDVTAANVPRRFYRAVLVP